jgi:SAM-dependent methyltransferase
MDEQLDRIRRAYDLTVQQYHDAVDPLDQIPTELRDSAELIALLQDANASNSGASDNREFLDPRAGMRFLDVGCGASLANYHLYRWESTYFGIDVSSGLIEAMNRFVRMNSIPIGGLSVAELAELPFDGNSFDISGAIGVMEYCPVDYVVRALSELHRVLKPGSRLVLDIPNPESPLVDTMFRLEECLGRMEILHSRSVFEAQLEPLFAIERFDDARVMLKYFCVVMK